MKFMYELFMGTRALEHQVLLAQLEAMSWTGVALRGRSRQLTDWHLADYIDRPTGWRD